MTMLFPSTRPSLQHHRHGGSLAILLFLLLATTLIPSFAQVWNTTGTSSGTALHLRGAPLPVREQRSMNDPRYLMEGHNDFELLECNQPACRAGTSTWTAEGYDPAAGLVVIPCGTCVTMDYPGPVLELPFGLDVQGSLIFPDAYKVQIETPFVLVQGNLHMSATNAVTGQPNVRILLTGTDDSLTEFIPAGNNRYACSEVSNGTPEPCRQGAKSFIIAGGRLAIVGLPDRCKTWVRLEALVASSDGVIPEDYARGLPILDPDHPNTLCRSYSTPYINESFEEVIEHGWTGGNGAMVRTTPAGFLRVWDSKSTEEHGPTFDMINIRDCLVPGQQYLFSCRVRFTSETRSGLTTCARKGSYCLELRSYVRLENGQIARRKAAETQTDGFRYGRWDNFYASLSFDRSELDADAIYQILRLEGLESDVVIDLDDVRFYLPPPDLVPDKTEVCNGNLIRNGDASASEIHPFPLESWGGRLSVMTPGNGISYFRIESRSSSTDSIAYRMPAPACMVAGGRYRVSARVRVKANVPVETIIVFRAFSTGAVARFVMAECPASSRQFVKCDSEFVVPPDFHSDKIDELRLSFETPGSRAAFEVDDWLLELVAGSKEALLVQEDGVTGCWDNGAEILVTSHTTDLESAQVRRLASTPKRRGDGFVRLDLDEPIIPPVTVQDGDGFAVEAAILSRNILLEGATDDPDSLLGGHLIVLHTPDVPQKLQGVEIKNFGRQGQLGKYPIHFHLCNSVEGAIVSKNSIRYSNQRCVVVHGTHNLTVADNVAFETKGHCYMTEDGGEFDNVFRGNLGASTRSASRLVRSFESDRMNPSTFWAPNPANTWTGNVAAGSESMGFWFELQDTVRPPTSHMPLSQGVVPRRITLKLFVDNIAHSNRKSGLRTYPFGFLPPQEVIFDNTRCYKNRLDGVFLHNTMNVQLRGGALADNGVHQADLDRADNIFVNGVQIIGLTERYQDIVSTQADAPTLPDALVGLELHSFASDTSRQGAAIRNVNFSGFPVSLGKSMALIQIDDDKWSGTFDYWSTIEGVTIDSDSSPFQFSFLKASRQNISNIYLTDLDSGMNPSSSSMSGTSTVMSDSNEMKAFVDLDRCDSFPQQGYLYCRNTCLRTITYATSPAETEDFYLLVADETGRSFLFPGRYHYETGNAENADMRKRRYFTPALPAGEYSVEFRSRKNGPVSWPTFVETTFEASQCSGSVRVDGVHLNVPPASNQDCAELIVNGDMEMSTDSYPHWLQRDNGIELASGRGVSRSNALVDMSQASSRGSIGQFVDTRCLTLGEQFDVRVWILLERNGSPFPCDGRNCPSVGLRVRQAVDAAGTDFSEFSIPVASSFVRPFDTNGWNLMQSTFTVDQRLVGAASVALSVDRGLSNVRMHLDNISVSRIAPDCSNLVLNGDFSDEKSVFWEKEGSAKSELDLIEMEGDPALVLMKRASNSDSMIQQIRVGCLTRDELYVASARFRLIQTNGDEFHCNPSSRDQSVSCPRMRLRSFLNVGQPDQDVRVHPGGTVAAADHGVRSNGWHTISGIFSATRFDELADKIVLSFVDAPVGKNLVVDDVSISLAPTTCMQLLMNGDAEADETARFWQSIGGGSKTTIDVVRLAGSQVFKISRRTNTGDGMQQAVDPKCFTDQQNWKFSARMKLMSKSSGKGVSCDPQDTRVSFACPPIVITGLVGGEKVVEIYRMTNKLTWGAEAFNNYEVEFVAPASFSAANILGIAIRTYNLDWELFVDDMSLSPL